VVSSVGVIADVSVKLSGDELKKRTVKRKTKVRVWSSVGLVMRCVCVCVWLSELVGVA